MAQYVTVETSKYNTETWARLTPYNWVFITRTGTGFYGAYPTELEALYRKQLEQ